VLERLLDAESLGLSLPHADVELGRILRDATHLLADGVKAILGLATRLDGGCRISSMSRRIAE
jgi:hypothetical protein